MGMDAARKGARRVRNPPGQFPGDAADDRQRAVPQHALQPRRRAQRRNRRRALGVRSESVRRWSAAQRYRLRSSRRRRMARRGQRQQAAHLHQQPLSPDLSRRGDGRPGRQLRHARRRRLEPRAGLGDQEEALHEHVAADRLQEPRDPRQRRGRSPRVPQRSARRHPRLRRAHRKAGVDVPHRFRSRASSGTTPGSRIRGASPDTPTRGRR